MALAEKNLEQLQKEVLETQLETAKIALDKTRDENADYRRRKDVAASTNAGRQRQFKHDYKNLRNLQRNVCQHMAGGRADGNPLEGGGKFAFSVLHITIMPDNVSEFIQCSRCRLGIIGRLLSPKEESKLRLAAEAVEKKTADFESDPVWLKYDDYKWWKELREQYKRDGIGKEAVSRGPGFAFTNQEGIPVIPDTQGYTSSGGGGR
jgi:hypothetical protein